MDKNPFKSSQTKTPRQKGIKNAGFIALVVLLVLIVVAAYSHPTNLKTISLSQTISDGNAGDYKTILVNGTQLQITPKGEFETDTSIIYWYLY